MIETRIIKTDTGEVVSSKDTHFTDSFTETGVRLQRNKSGFTAYNEVEFPAGMSDADIGKMNKLARFLYKDNTIGDRGREKPNYYDSREIGLILGLSDRPTRNFLNKMERLCVIKAVEGRYYVNPTYFLRNGQNISVKLFKLFKGDGIKKLLTQRQLSWLLSREAAEKEP